jgi:hypothetical protein
MHVHSVYHNEEVMKEKYHELKGGMNKMTISKAFQIITSFKELRIEETRIDAWRGLTWLAKFSLSKEFFGSAIYFKIQKKG